MIGSGASRGGMISLIVLSISVDLCERLSSLISFLLVSLISSFTFSISVHPFSVLPLLRVMTSHCSLLFPYGITSHSMLVSWLICVSRFLS